MATINDYIDNTQASFKNKVYVRVYLKKSLDYFFVLYFDFFVWIVKNAYHSDKFLENYRPPSVDPILEKEKGRKNIRQFLKNAIVVKTLLKRDSNLMAEFIEKRSDFFTDSYLETAKTYSEYLLKRLFEMEAENKGSKPPAKFLDDAIKKIRENFKK